MLILKYIQHSRSSRHLGYMVVSPDGGTQLGGIAVNVSGPCLRDGDFVKVSQAVFG